jgi:hypothetical protein
MPERTASPWLWSLAALIVLLTGGVLVLALAGFGVVPPPVPPEVRALAAAPVVAEADGTTRLGRCWTGVRAGAAFAVLSGPPAARGLALARLCPLALRAADADRAAAAARRQPLAAVRWVLDRGRTLLDLPKIRDLGPAATQELAGLALAAAEGGWEAGRAYARWAVFAAAPEVARAWTGEGSGEAAFCARAQATTAGSPLLACALNAGLGPGPDPGRVVVQVRPEAGLSYVTCLWPGQVGVLCGVNQAGIGVALLNVPGAGSDEGGEPASFAARRVLAGAATLEAAVELVRTARLSTPGLFLLGSGPENAFAAVERTPGAAAVRRVQEPTAAWACLFTSPELRDDPANLRVLRDGAAVLRTRRLRELAASAAGTLDPARCVLLLRDRRGTDGTPLGLGHDAAVESCTSDLAVVLDLARRRLWVGAGPHALGAFVPFGAEGPDDASDPLPVPADPALARGDYSAYARYHAGLTSAEALIALGRFRQALAGLQEVRPLNADHYRSYLLAGRALEALGLQDEARYNYAEARRRYPARTGEREELDRKLRRLTAAP